MFSLFTSYSFAENKVNFTISASEDFTGKEFKSDKKANKVYLFLKDNTFKKKGKDFRKFGKYSNCKKRFKISAELEDAILNSDFDKIEIIVKKNIKN